MMGPFVRKLIGWMERHLQPYLQQLERKNLLEDLKSRHHHNTAAFRAALHQRVDGCDFDLTLVSFWCALWCLWSSLGDSWSPAGGTLDPLVVC